MTFSKSATYALIATSVYLTPLFAANVAISKSHPGSIPLSKVPVFVSIGWDDNTSADGITWARSLFDGKTNPDQTPLASSFYSNSSTMSWDANLVTSFKSLATSNHEIGNHTWDHQDTVAKKFDAVNGASSVLGWNSMTWFLRNQATAADWKEIVTRGSDSLSFYTQISKTVINQGFRSPYLENGTNLYPALKEMGFRYDCSIEEYSDDAKQWNWPYTLDAGSPSHAASWKANPENTIDLDGDTLTKTDVKAYNYSIPVTAGLWELPVYGLLIPDDATCPSYGISTGLRTRIKSKITWMTATDNHLTGFDYNLWGLAGLSKAEFVGILKYNLDLRLAGNRAPFLFGAHSQYYVGTWATENAKQTNAADMKAAIAEFIQYAASKPEVRIVPASKVLDWMENPTEITNVTVTNEAPTGITLSNATVETGATIIGTLTSVDKNAGDTFTYTVITGSDKFEISGNTLKLKPGVAVGKHTVTVRTTDNGGLYFGKDFTVTVTEKAAAYEVIGADYVWAGSADALGTGSVAAVTSTSPLVLKLTRGANVGADYSWVSAGTELDTTIESVTQIEITYTADQAVNFGLSGVASNGNNYGFVAPLAAGTNVKDTLKLADFTYSWSDSLSPVLHFNEVRGIGIEAGEFVGASNVTVTSLKLYGYVKPSTGTTTSKDTIEAIGTTGFDYSDYHDSVVVGDSSYTKIGTGSVEFMLQRAGDTTYPGAMIAGPAGFADTLRSIELVYSSTADLEMSLPMTGAPETDAAHSVIVPASTNETKARFYIGDFIQTWGTTTTLDPKKVESIAFGLVDASLAGKITLKSVKLIYSGEKTVVKQTAAVKATALAVTGIFGNKLNLSVPTAGQYEISVYSLNGQKLGSMSHTLAAGTASVNIGSLNLASRMAIVEIAGANVQCVSKVMIK